MYKLPRGLYKVHCVCGWCIANFDGTKWWYDGYQVFPDEIGTCVVKFSYQGE